MFTREEASRIRHEFWTTFGKYMSPILSSEGVRINWANYHTGIKEVYFRMDAGLKSAAIYISMEHRDPASQELYFEQFKVFKNLLHATLQEEWDWQLHTPGVDGKILSKISKETLGVSVLNRNHWPDLISFFKPRIILLDTFWENAKYSFEMLK
jgi:hypothetical protein